MRFLNDISKVVYIKKAQQSFNYTNEGLLTWQIFFKKKRPLMSEEMECYFLHQSGGNCILCGGKIYFLIYKGNCISLLW